MFEQKMQRFSLRRMLCYGVLLVGFIVVVSRLSCRFSAPPGPEMVLREQVQYSHDGEHRAYPYDKEMPLIFIGGMPRSGTTLVRGFLCH